MRRLYILYQQSLKAIGALFLFALLLSCADEPMIDVDTEGDTGGAQGWIWTPTIEIQKGNNQATLLLMNPMPGATSTVPGPDNPDYYKIWVSTTGLENFNYYRTADAPTTSLQFDQLENGKAYYFFVTSHKENFPSGHSDTVMTIPSEPSSLQPLFNIDLSVKRVSVTGFHYQFDSRYANPEWLNSEQMLITLSEGAISFPVIVNVN